MAPRLDAGTILGREAAGVETVVASIHGARTGQENWISSDSHDGEWEAGLEEREQHPDETDVMEEINSHTTVLARWWPIQSS